MGIRGLDIGGQQHIKKQNLSNKFFEVVNRKRTTSLSGKADKKFTFTAFGISVLC